MGIWRRRNRSYLYDLLLLFHPSHYISMLVRCFRKATGAGFICKGPVLLTSSGE